MAAGGRLPRGWMWWLVAAAFVAISHSGSARADRQSAEQCAKAPPAPIPLVRENSVLYPGFHALVARITPGASGFDMLRRSTALKPNCHRHFVPDVPGGDIWFRFETTYSGQNASSWVLALEEPQIARMTVHEILPNGTERIKRNGAEVPDRDRDMRLRRVVVGLAPASDGVTRYLVHIDPGVSPTVTPSLQRYAHYETEETAYLVVLCTFIGFLGAIALYNINLFFNLGVSAAPFYVIYTVLIIINTAIFGGLTIWMTPWTWPRAVLDHAMELTALGAALSLVHYCRLLLRLGTEWPAADRWVKGLNAALLGAYAIHLIDPPATTWPLHLVYIIGIVMLCALAYRRARQGNRPARLVSIGFIFLFVGVATQTILYYQAPTIEEVLGIAWFSKFSVQDGFFYLGIAGEATFMSVAVLAFFSDGSAPVQTSGQLQLDMDDRNRRFLAALDAATDAHMAELDLDVGRLANLLAVSERTLRRRLHEVSATTPAEYVRRRRLERARLLIENNSFGTVAEVARAVGLAHAGHFAKLYREAFGHLPKEGLRAAPSTPDADTTTEPVRTT